MNFNANAVIWKIVLNITKKLYNIARKIIQKIHRKEIFILNIFSYDQGRAFYCFYFMNIIFMLMLNAYLLKQFFKP